MATSLSNNNNNNNLENMKDLNQLMIDRLRAINLDLKDRKEHRKLKRASVLVPLVLLPTTFNNSSNDNDNDNDTTNQNDNEKTYNHSLPSCLSWYILFTKRPDKMSTHAGEVCFPGGRQDPEDNLDDVVTAKRETLEEVGIPGEYIEPISRLETLESVHHLCVTPIIGILQDQSVIEKHLKINPTEVDSAFFVPLVYFADVNENCVKTNPVEWNGGVFVLRTYQYKCNHNVPHQQQQTYTIWGLTAHIARLVANIAVAAPKSGELFISMEGNGRRNPYWSQCWFHLDPISAILHQYDSKQHATRKESSATKKNRLTLVDTKIFALNKEINENNNDNDKKIIEYYPFTVSVLDGRIEWKLAATTPQDQQAWMEAIQQYTTKKS